jgi:hypothetical protein
MATRGRLKIDKNHFFALIFPSKFISKCCIEIVKGFSALVTHYLIIDLGSFLASHKSKIFLAMRENTAPLQTPQTEGRTSPFWQAPDVPF